MMLECLKSPLTWQKELETAPKNLPQGLGSLTKYCRVNVGPMQYGSSLRSMWAQGAWTNKGSTAHKRYVTPCDPLPSTHCPAKYLYPLRRKGLLQMFHLWLVVNQLAAYDTHDLRNVTPHHLSRKKKPLGDGLLVGLSRSFRRSFATTPFAFAETCSYKSAFAKLLPLRRTFGIRMRAYLYMHNQTIGTSIMARLSVAIINGPVLEHGTFCFSEAFADFRIKSLSLGVLNNNFQNAQVWDSLRGVCEKGPQTIFAGPFREL